MKPLNRKERRIAFMKFLGVFLLAIAIVISSAFVAGVKIPPSAYSTQGQFCQDRETLARYIDTLDMHVAVLREMDKALAGQTNEIEKGEQLNDIVNAEIKLTGFLQKIKNLKTDLPEKNAVFDIGSAYLLLRTTAKKPVSPPVVDSGADACDPWKKRVADANERIEDLKQIAADASKDLNSLKVKMVNINKGDIRNKIKEITDDLEDAKAMQKVPEY